MSARAVLVPYRLGWGAALVGGGHVMVPGRGEAGWSAMWCADGAAVLEFMARYPEAEMPCWSRLRGEVAADEVASACRALGGAS